MASLNFNPERDISNLTGKVIFITGGTAGLGEQSIAQIAAHNPARIYFTGRNEKAAASTIERIKTIAPKTHLTFIQWDQASLESIKTAIITHFKSARLDVLMCNAGIMNQPAAQTADGYELQFGTNHMGHALLIKMLLPTLLKTAENGGDVRIVILTSQGAFAAKTIDFATVKTPQSHFWIAGGYQRYGSSKLSNILYAKQLSIEYPQLKCFSIHPGVVKTGLVEREGYLSKAVIYLSQGGRLLERDQGAWNQVWAAVGDVKGVENGGYYEPVGVSGKDKGRLGWTDLAKELWDWTQKELEAW